MDEVDIGQRSSDTMGVYNTFYVLVGCNKIQER